MYLIFYSVWTGCGPGLSSTLQAVWTTVSTIIAIKNNFPQHFSSKENILSKGVSGGQHRKIPKGCWAERINPGSFCHRSRKAAFRAGAVPQTQALSSKASVIARLVLISVWVLKLSPCPCLPSEAVTPPFEKKGTVSDTGGFRAEDLDILMLFRLQSSWISLYSLAHTESISEAREN